MDQYIFIMSVIGTMFIAYLIVSTHRGEATLKAYMKIGIEFNHTKVNIIKIVMEIILFFVIGAIFYTKIFLPIASNCYNVRGNVFGWIFLANIFILAAFTIIVDGFHQKISREIIFKKPTVILKNLIDSILYIIILMPTIAFALELWNLLFTYKINVIDKRSLLIQIYFYQGIILILTNKLTRMLKSLYKLSEAAICSIIFKVGVTKKYKIIFTDNNFIYIINRNKIEYIKKSQIDSIGLPPHIY